MVGIKRVLVAMSGGVDSSVAALLLKQKGYEVIGVTMHLYDSDCSIRGCCSPKDMEDARTTADYIGIKHYIIDMRDLFDSEVIQSFINEYINNRTPNPCIVCNERLKFTHLVSIAEKFGCTYLATGHYARIEKKNGKKTVYKGIDKTRDQSYFLFNIPITSLDKILFPLGYLTKKKVREIAMDHGLPVRDKRESREICFVGKKNYWEYIIERIEKCNIDFSGKIRDKDGNILGEHPCYMKYTIGQRKGIGIASPKPLYVIKKVGTDIIVGTKSDLKRKTFTIKGYQWYLDPMQQKNLYVKIRYLSTPSPCKISFYKTKVLVVLEKEMEAITPGQAAVFYTEDGAVVGGGWIYD